MQHDAAQTGRSGHGHGRPLYGAASLSDRGGGTYNAARSPGGASVAKPRARVAIIMGSASDWDVMKAAEQMLDELGIASDARVISAHRTPERLTRFLATAE